MSLTLIYIAYNSLQFFINYLLSISPNKMASPIVAGVLFVPDHLFIPRS